MVPIRRKIIGIIMRCVDICIRVISFGMNPRNGGKPASDKSRIDSDRVL